MYAICEYADYEEYGIYCIEIDSTQKELFEKYCKDSRKVGASHGETIELKGYSDLDYKKFVADINRLDVSLFIDCMTIKEHQEKCKKTLEYIPQHGNHYLKNKIDELNKLIEYRFK